MSNNNDNDNEDSFSPKKDYALYVKRVKLKVNNVNAERPKVNKVLFQVPDFLKKEFPSGYVSFKPRTTYTVEEEDEEGDIVESEHHRRYYKDELKDSFEKIDKLLEASKVLQEDELIRLTGTITKTENNNDDMEYDIYWYIDTNNWKTIEASKVDMAEAMEEVQDTEAEEESSEESDDQEKSEDGEEENQIL